LNAIDIKNVEFSYSTEPEKTILNITHWSVKQGEQMLIHGYSGSGKSTLLDLVCGISLPNTGSVCVLGEQLNKLNSRQRDKYRALHIGYIFQRFNLIEYLNAIDNIKLAHHFASKANSSALINHIKELLTTLNVDSADWYRPISQLSVGQQQRVGIARALINKPRLIIADEPTSSLDQTAIENFMSLLISICEKQGTTLLFVSHDLSLKKYFNSSLALSDINQLKSN